MVEPGVKVLFTMGRGIKRPLRRRLAEQYEVDATTLHEVVGGPEVVGCEDAVAVVDAVDVAVIGRADDPVAGAVEEFRADVHEGEHRLGCGVPARVAFQVGGHVADLAAGQRLAGGVLGDGVGHHEVAADHDRAQQHEADEAAAQKAAQQVAADVSAPAQKAIEHHGEGDHEGDFGIAGKTHVLHRRGG